MSFVAEGFTYERVKICKETDGAEAEKSLQDGFSPLLIQHVFCSMGQEEALHIHI
jgi:hypothetical protein